MTRQNQMHKQLDVPFVLPSRLLAEVLAVSAGDYLTYAVEHTKKCLTLTTLSIIAPQTHFEQLFTDSAKGKWAGAAIDFGAAQQSVEVLTTRGCVRGSGWRADRVNLDCRDSQTQRSELERTPNLDWQLHCRMQSTTDRKEDSWVVPTATVSR